MNTKLGKEREKGRTRMRVFGFIVQYMISHKGIPPTYREIFRGVGLNTTSSIHLHLAVLAEHNLISLPKNRISKSRQITLPGGIYAAPRNVIAGNINNVTETSIFIDRNSEHAEALMKKFGSLANVSAHWYTDEISRNIAFKLLHPDQVAVITDAPEITLMAIAHKTAVYLPENVLCSEPNGGCFEKS